MVEEITPEAYHLLVEEEGKKRNKYHAIPVQDEVYGYFASTGEHRRWYELLRLQDLPRQEGAVRHLRRQVPYALTVNGVPVCGYVSDFEYDEYHEEDAGHFAHWEHVVEDWKGKRTEAYKIKRALMLACHGIALRETGQ